MFKKFVRSTSINSILSAVESLYSKRPQTLPSTVRSTATWPFTFNRMNRYWESINQNESKSLPSSCQYKLLSYNILAQDLLTEHLHLYIDIDPTLLRWNHRLAALRDEILYINPDILCLQEMQYNHLKCLVEQISCKRELEYVFKKKTGFRTDGCAIIYDRSKFHLVEDQFVEYHVPGNVVLNRDNVALLAKFKVKKDPQNTFIVATTHLLYNPRRQDVRTAQVKMLMEALQQFSITEKDGKKELVPVILTGDFNFQPDSHPYQSFSQTVVSPCQLSTPQKADSPNKRSRPGESVRIPFDGEEFSEGLQMLPLKFGLNTASTFQEEWITVDYVLYSVGDNRKKIKIWTVYNLPTIKECRRIGKIPNQNVGSDHYSLGITFSLL